MIKSNFSKEPNKISRFIDKHEIENIEDLNNYKKKKLEKIKEKADDILWEVESYKEEGAEGLSDDERGRIDQYILQLKKIMENINSKLNIEDEEKDNSSENFNEKLRELGENTDGFQELSGGQQSLVLENFKQLFLSNIKEGAQKNYKQELGESKFLGKILKGILKNYKIADLEKKEAKESFKLESETDKQIMEKLVQGMEAYGPEVKLGENGEIEIQYAGEWKNLNEEEQKTVDNFNKVATKYSHLSYEWSLDTSTKKQAKQFEAIKNEYEDAKGEIINLKKEKSIKKLEEKEEDALLYINKIDGQIQMNQFLNNNPEVEKELSNIKDQKIWKKALTGVIRERGIYTAAGFITRSVTTAAIGAIAVPLAAAGIGGWRANVRAREGLKQNDINARHGQKDNSAQAKNVVDLGERSVQYRDNKNDADIVTVRKGLIGKIDKLINDIENARGAKKKELLDKLDIRLKYTQGKIDDGLVNFGKKEDKLNNQYLLIHKLSDVHILLQTNNFTERTFKNGKSIGSELEKLLNLKTRNISEERKKHIIKKTLIGAGISAGFASAGYLIRHFMGGHGLFDKSEVKDEISEVQKIVEETKGSSITEEAKIDSTEAIKKTGIFSTIKKNYEESDLNNEGSAPEVSEETVEVDATGDSLKAEQLKIDPATGAVLKYDAHGNLLSSSEIDSAGVDLEEFEADGVTPIVTPEITAATELGISENISNNEEVTPDTMAKLLALKGRSDGNVDDILENNDSCAVIEKGEGVSQALGEFEDSNMQATVINPDGTRIEGDINLAHTGDTVIQKDGEIYIFKTSGVEVSKDDSLANAWIKVTEEKLGRELTSEEIDQFDGEDGKLEWNEAKALHDKLTSEKPEVVVENTPSVEDQAALEEKIQDLQTNQEEHVIPDKPSAEDLDTSMEAEVDTSDDLADTENMTAGKPDAEDLEESMNAGVDQSKIYEQFFNNENASAMSKLNNETSGDVIIRLGRPIEMKSSDGFFVKVDGFRFTGEDNTGRHFEYFKVGKNDPSEEVIFKLTENDSGNGINNIEIKGYDDIDNTEHVIPDKPDTEDLEASMEAGVENLNQGDTNSQLTNSDYSNVILKAEVNNDLEALGKELKLDVDGAEVEIDHLRLVSKAGAKENGEITKHFIARDIDGKEYSLTTKEHWRQEPAWDDSDKSSYVNDGVIKYDVKEIVNDKGN